MNSHPKLDTPYVTGSRNDRIWSVASSQRMRKVKKGWGAGVVVYAATLTDD